MDTTEFSDKMIELRQIITDGVVYLTAWQAIYSLDDIQAKALSRYKGFFLSCQLSFKNMAIIEVGKIFDKDKRTPSLVNLVDVAINDRERLTPYATDSDLRKIKQWIDENEHIITRLKHLRDKRVAHHDSIYTKQSLLFGDVKNLINGLLVQFNLLTSWHNRSTTSLDNILRVTEAHTKKVIAIMCDDMEKDVKPLKE